MKDFVDGTAFNAEQGNRARKLSQPSYWLLWTTRLPTTRNTAMARNKLPAGRARDGREVLSCAGIDPNERVVSGLMDFVGKGVRTSVALSREESERRNAAAQAEAA